MNTRKHRNAAGKGRIAAAILALSLTPAGLYAAQDFTAAIPQDALFAIWASDVPSLREAGASGPYGRLFADPALANLKDYAAKKMEEMRADTEGGGEEFIEALEHLKGGIALFGTSNGDEDPNMYLLVEVDETGAEWMSKKAQEEADENPDATRDSYEVQGVEVRRIQGTTTIEDEFDEMGLPAEPREVPSVTQYGQIDNVFFITSATGDAPVRELIARMKEPGAGALSARPEAATVTKHLQSKTNSLSAFFNSGSALNQWVESLAVADPMMRRKLQSTGLLDIDSVYLTTTLGADKIDFAADIVTPNGRQGVLQALTSSSNMQLDILSLVPSNVNSATVFSFDLGAVLDASLKAADEFNPGTSMMFNMYTMGMQSELGVDVLNGIIKNIAGEHLFVARPIDPETAKGMEPEEAAMAGSSSTYFSLRNPEATAGALKSLITALQQHPDYGASLDVVDQEGVTVVRVKNPMMEEQSLPSIAVTNDRIIYASDDVQMQEAIRGVTAAATESLAETPALSDALANVSRENLILFNYSPAGSVGRGVDQFRMLVETGLFGEFDEELDASMIPSAEVVEKYIGDSFMTINAAEGSLQINSVLREAKAAQ